MQSLTGYGIFKSEGRRENDAGKGHRHENDSGNYGNGIEPEKDLLPRMQRFDSGNNSGNNGAGFGKVAGGLARSGNGEGV